MGRVLFLQRRYEDALEQIQTVLDIDPEDLMAHYNLMLCYRALGRKEDAEVERRLYERFKADERAYLDEWDMTEQQKQGVLDRDLNRLISLGGNIYFLAKIGATDGLSFQQMAGSMTGMSEDEYRAMMVGGGRSIDGNRYVDEQGGDS